MSTKYIHHPTAIVPAASRDAINAYFTRQNLGPIFSIPLVIGNAGQVVKDDEPLITHYGTSLPLNDAWSGILDRQLAAHGGQRVEKRWDQALTDLSAKRDIESHPYQIIMVVTPGANTSINNRLTSAGIPNADARFFKIGLSATGIAPVTRYLEHIYADAGFAPVLKQIADAFPRAEIFLGTRDGNGDALKKVYGDVKYQSSDFVNRRFARVWIGHKWTQDEVLKTLDLVLVV